MNTSRTCAGPSRNSANPKHRRDSCPPYQPIRNARRDAARRVSRYGTAGTTKTCLVDFLADGADWCDQAGEDYAELDRCAYQHYLAEINNL